MWCYQAQCSPASFIWQFPRNPVSIFTHSRAENIKRQEEWWLVNKEYLMPAEFYLFQWVLQSQICTHKLSMFKLHLPGDSALVPSRLRWSLSGHIGWYLSEWVKATAHSMQHLTPLCVCVCTSTGRSRSNQVGQTAAELRDHSKAAVPRHCTSGGQTECEDGFTAKYCYYLITPVVFVLTRCSWICSHLLKYRK